MREATIRRLNSRCGGLLEVDEQSENVTFLHRTVMDFLLTRDTSDLLASKTPPHFDTATCLLKVYTARIKSTHFPYSVRSLGLGKYNNSKLVSQLNEALAYAAEREEQMGNCDRTGSKLLD
jgi:hypothetical protein